MRSRKDNKIVVVSKCLLGFRCRYDGEIINYKITRLLKKKGFRVYGVCPEMEIGLGVPRNRIRFVLRNNKLVLVQEKTRLRLKRRLEGFSKEFLLRFKRVDAFILKSRSPSCGNGDCKIYKSIKDDTVVGYTDGVFTRLCKKMHPDALLFNENDKYFLKNFFNRSLLHRKKSKDKETLIERMYIS